MKKEIHIKDKQKLFKKLFISPSYFQPLDPPLLVSPDFIHLLLQQSNNTQKEYQKELINEILNIFIQRPINSLLLYKHDQQKYDTQKCILDIIILKILELITNQQQIQLYCQKIVLMLAYYRIGLRNFRKLTQWLYKKVHLQKIQTIKFIFILKIIKLYYSKKLGQYKSPLHYFYIFGNQGTGIQPISNTNQLLIKSQLTFVINFNSQGKPYNQYNLILIKTQKKQQIGLTFCQGTLKLTALNNGQYLDEYIIIKQLSQQVWYRLVINMNTTQTICILDNQTYKGKSLLKKQKQRKIIGCIFGRQFFGMIGNILISNKSISYQKFDMNLFPYGIDTIDNLIVLNKTNIPSNIILSCLPFCTFQVRQIMHCFDIFRRNHSTISDNILIVNQNIRQDNIQYLGGSHLILPLFYLARFYKFNENIHMLEDLLNILYEILKIYDIEKIQKQMCQNYFIEILGQHLGDISYMQNQKSLNILLAIYRLFRLQRNKIVFIRDVLWALNIGITNQNSSITQQQQQIQLIPQNKLDMTKSKPSLPSQSTLLIQYYYKLILTLYETESKILYKSLSFTQILYWIVQHLQTNYNLLYSCCIQHYINQIILENDVNNQELIKLNNNKLSLHYKYLQNILGRYIENFIKNNDQNIVEYFKILLRLLLQKYSPCFYLMILKIIRKQIQIFNNNKIIINIICSQKLQILSFLIFLSQKTINPDILTQILFITLFVYKNTNNKKKQDIVRFICNLLKINQQIQIKNCNPIIKIVKNIRKNSVNQLHIQNQFQIDSDNQDNEKLNKSFSHFNRKKLLQQQINKHKICQILTKTPKPQHLSTYQSFYNLIINQLSNIISLQQPKSQQQIPQFTQQSILILKQYYKLSTSLYKQNILLHILINLQKNQQLHKSPILTLFLLQSLKQSIYIYPKQTKTILTIFTCIFSQIILQNTNNNNINNVIQYYCSIKYLKYSRVSISLILPNIISKIIKLCNIKHLQQFIMICLYQIIQGNLGSVQLGKIVLGEFGERIGNIIKNIKLNKQEDEKQVIQNQNMNDQIANIFNKNIMENIMQNQTQNIHNPFEQKQQQNYKQSLISSYQTQYKNASQIIIIQSQKQDVKIQQFTQNQMNVSRNSISRNQIATNVLLTENNIQTKQNKDNKGKSQKKKKDDKLIQQNGKNKVNKKQSSSSNNSKNHNENKQQYITQITVIEVYIKLFFKILQKIYIKSTANKINQQILQRKPLSIIQDKIYGKMQQKQSFMETLQVPQIQTQQIQQIKRKKSVQLSYSYQFKTQSKLIKQFLSILTVYFKTILYNNKNKQKGFIKYIITQILYKIYKINKQFNKTIIQPSQFLQIIFANTIQPFMDQNIQNIEQIINNIISLDGKTIFLSYFIRNPLKYKLNDFVLWKNDKKYMKDIFNKDIIQYLFVNQERYVKYLAAIQNKHQLLFINIFQRTIQRNIQKYENLVLKYANDKSYKNIQKLFDTENTSQQKTRVRFLYQNQCRFRKYHYEWDKIWNKLRIYHQPYGFWMAQKFLDNKYVYNNGEIRNFKFEMSEYSSQTSLYPILQAKIIEPWNIIKDNRIKKNRYINSFSQMMKPSHIKNSNIQNQNNNNNNNIFTHLWKGMLGLSKLNLNNLGALLVNQNSKQKAKQYQVVYISRSTKATGKLFIRNKQDILFCYEGARQQDTHLSFQKFSLAFNRQTYQIWSLYSIDKIRIHRYLLKYQALQIQINDGRSIIFNFINNDKQQFLKQIQKIQKQKSISLKLYKLNKIPLFLDNFIQYKIFDSKITERWQKRQISNLQYLTQINRAASRGIYDLSQYMVVPWVVEFKREKQPKYRDLSKTMGGLGSQQRKKIISQKYFAKDPFNPYPPFFFGTHYSSPGVVFNFLIRLSPFTEYCKHLQGGKFDIPDRLFNSLISTWRSASQQVSDVRQLIPQMYYLPQIFINIDENHFGYTQNGQLVNHIQLPPWGANNPYYFTSQMRQILQSQQVSQKLNQWIDLIFGYKQKGKQAQQAYNIYYYLTYQNSLNQQDNQQDDIYIKSKQAQIVHFGQIPPQLFQKSHIKRNKCLTNIYQVKIVRTIKLINTFKQKIIGMKIDGNQLYIFKRNQFQVYNIQSNPATLQKKKKFNFQKSMSNSYYLIKKQKCHIHILDKNYFIIWGYFSNQFRLFNKNTGTIDQADETDSKIMYLHVNKSEDLILVGTLSGLLYIYEIQYGLNQVFVKKIGIQVFPAPIVHISQNDGFFAITFGNYTSIYKINRSFHYLTQTKTKCSIKFFRSFYNPLPIKASFIMCSPLYSIIIIDNANIKSYSINGQFIKNINNSAKNYGNFKDLQLHDVFYTIDEDKIICYSVPDLRNISIYDLGEHQQIYQKYIIYKDMIQEIGYDCQ